MKKVYMRSCIWLLVLLLMVPVGGLAQDTGSAPPVFRQEELDQMLAPIALYPDALLIQMLIASTYPLEVVQAARWVNANPDLKGENLAIALEQKYWDPSVKSLVNFPSVLAMMNDKLEWTQNLGDAFLGQKDQVMATVQDLRLKAQAQGTLETTSEQVVVVRENTIVIEPADPHYIYVPAYDPFVVYGTWWYPSYPPYYYYPRGYFVPGGSALYFGVGVAYGVAWGYAWGSVNWASNQIYVNPAQNITTNNTYYTSQVNVNVQNTVNSGSAPPPAPLPPPPSPPPPSEPSSGSVNRSATVTTGSGNTATYTGSTVRNADGSITNTGTVTGLGGQTSTMTGTSDGSGNRSGTLTTGSGNTATYTGSTVRNPDGSVTNSGTVTGPAGNTGSRSATTSVDPMAGTIDRSVTSPAGHTRTFTGTAGISGTGGTTGTTGTTGQRTTALAGTTGQGTTEWQHDPSHRQGVAYKNPSVSQQFGQTGNTGTTARKDFRGFDQSIPNQSSSLQRSGSTAQETMGNIRQTTGQRKSTSTPNTGGQQPYSGRNMDGSLRTGSTTSQNRSASAIESSNRGGTEVKQQSIRGRSSRESVATQNPSQSYRGGSVNQRSSIPNTGSSSVPTMRSGSSSVPNTGSGSVPNMRGGSVPNTGSGGGVPRGGARTK